MAQVTSFLSITHPPTPGERRVELVVALRLLPEGSSVHGVRIFLCGSFSQGGGWWRGPPPFPHADFLWQVNLWNARSLNKGTQGHLRATVGVCAHLHEAQLVRDGLYHDSEVRNAKETVDTTTLFGATARCRRS